MFFFIRNQANGLVLGSFLFEGTIIDLLRRTLSNSKPTLFRYMRSLRYILNISEITQYPALAYTRIKQINTLKDI